MNPVLYNTNNLLLYTIGIGYGSRSMYAGQAPYPGMYPGGSSPVVAGDAQETTFLYIPNNAVGAIIGTKGSHIRNIIRFSGASVKIAPLDETKPQETPTERKVTIVGSPEAQWKVILTFSPHRIPVTFEFSF